MNKHPRRALLVNTFGMFGYLFCLISWGWTAILYVPMLLANKQIEGFLLPPPSENPVITAPPSEPMSPVMVFFAFAVAAIVMIVTIVALLRAPITIAKTGQTVTVRAADSALPLVTHGRPLPPAEKRRLTVRLIKLAKLLLVLLPVAVASLGKIVELPLPPELVMLISGTLALIAVFFFSAQYIGARALGVKLDNLV